LNPLVKYQRHPFHLSPEKAIQLFSQYDLVLDCTDHPTSRYLISDACVLTGRPLVSASALKTEGQLIVLNHPPRPPGDPTGGPCYRCVFPKPPPAASVLSCGEGGIIGPVVGVMGVLQAIEAIKLITTTKPPNPQPTSHGSPSTNTPSPPAGGWTPSGTDPVRATLTIFSAYSTPQFRSVRMRARHASCAACSAHATVTGDSLATGGALAYARFCGTARPPQILAPSSRITAADFARLPRDGSNALIDVRDETQYQMCALRGSFNVPWTGDARTWLDRAFQTGALPSGSSDYYVVCRFGNDSQLAANALADLFESAGQGQMNVKDIKGGFRAWREEVDREWPDY
jgi:adenylyltransferase/sulfurtransferase